MDDLSLDMSHELELDQNRRAKKSGILRQQGMECGEGGNMGKRKRPMRGLRAKAKMRRSYDY